MKKILAASFFLSTLFISCDPLNGEEFGNLPCDVYGDSTVIDVKFSESVMPCNYSANFVSIVNESRCPTDGVCVTDGTAQIGVNLNYATSSFIRLDTLTITGSGIGQPKILSFNGINHRVRIIQLFPRPTVATPQPAANTYKARIAIVKL